MKKIVLSLGVFALLASCGSEESTNENNESTNNETTEEIVEAVPQELTFTSFDLLTQYEEGQEEFLESLKGNNITITQVLFQSGSETFMYGWGYNGSEMTLYSNPETGSSNIVRDIPVLANPGPNLGFELTNFTEETPSEFVQLEMIANENGGSDQVYHTMLTIVVPGDNITIKNTTTLVIDKAEIITHENF